jgi:hypothetical protein
MPSAIRASTIDSAAAQIYDGDRSLLVSLLIYLKSLHQGHNGSLAISASLRSYTVNTTPEVEQKAETASGRPQPGVETRSAATNTRLYYHPDRRVPTASSSINGGAATADLGRITRAPAVPQAARGDEWPPDRSTQPFRNADASTAGSAALAASLATARAALKRSSAAFATPARGGPASVPAGVYADTAYGGHGGGASYDPNRGRSRSRSRSRSPPSSPTRGARSHSRGRGAAAVGARGRDADDVFSASVRSPLRAVGSARRRQRTTADEW